MKKRALFVGVDHYEDEGFRDLRYSVADAAALAAAFGKHGFETHVATNPETSVLRREVRLRTAGLGPGDVFVFFFAGHGYTGPGGKHLLICRDDEVLGLRHDRAGVPVDLLEDLTNGKGFHRAFLLDACRTDVFSGMEGRGAAATRDLGLVALPDAGKNPGTCCVLRSCDRFCPALEFEDLGHGVFTRAVLDLLEAPHGHGVQMGEKFAAWVRERMRTILKQEGGSEEQNPSFQSNGAPFMLFGESDEGMGMHVEETLARADPQAEVAKGNAAHPIGQELSDGGDIFLRKVRLERELEEARRHSGTKTEIKALDPILKLFRDGAQALETGGDAVAEECFAKVDRVLDEWKESLAERQKEEAAFQHACERQRHLEIKLKSANRRKGITKAERAALRAFRDLCAAGAEALKVERRGLAEELFVEAEGKLDAWEAAVEARRKAQHVQKEQFLGTHKLRLLAGGLVLVLLSVFLFYCLRCGFDAAIEQTNRMLPWCWWHLRFVIGPGILVVILLFAYWVNGGDHMTRNALFKDDAPDLIFDPWYNAILMGIAGCLLILWIASVWHTFGVLGFAFRSFGVSLFLLAEYVVLGVAGGLSFMVYQSLAWNYAVRHLKLNDGLADALEEDTGDDAEGEIGWTEGSLQAGETMTLTLPGGATMEMAWCPPGSFMMGSPEGEEGRDDDETQHRVTLTKGFWMAKTPVTQRQWRSVMGGWPWNNPSYYKGDDLPVENVRWKDAQKFCRKAGLGLTLPTEAQWEYACRAGTTGPYAGTGRLEDMGWYGDNSGDGMHPVGRKRPNAWGLYDMHGNVWEWCADWYGNYPLGAVTDPKGASSGSGRVIRGGGWNNYALYCRSARRGNYNPSGNGGLAFRPSRILS